MGDLAVPADQGDADVVAGIQYLIEQCFSLIFGETLRHQQRGQEPPGDASGAGDVVGVHLHGIPAAAVRGHGYGVA